MIKPKRNSERRKRDRYPLPTIKQSIASPEGESDKDHIVCRQEINQTSFRRNPHHRSLSWSWMEPDQTAKSLHFTKPWSCCNQLTKKEWIRQSGQKRRMNAMIWPTSSRKSFLERRRPTAKWSHSVFYGYEVLYIDLFRHTLELEERLACANTFGGEDRRPSCAQLAIWKLQYAARSSNQY